ncbi:hypothetical protein PZA11_005951 [Diplocarpon coronariae]|uniref:Uncharacterized protein n=1 Tax=Diplocarpon coronariae TaxID=2795749 RepID=A0A218Z1L5_9HELO|nr:hypothetical protein JHW43_004280 [Diplocarpon mali]OWP01632.1 hypothetical protein B2J93_2148 [Marssonina coronariae]
MQLCRNRLEGFGPSSRISSPLPTSCFTDTILIPLPTWLGILLLALLLSIFSSKHHHHHPHHPQSSPSTSTFKSISTPSVHAGKSWLFILTSTLYYILILANILMVTLEIARLSRLPSGIGLLPFSYVGLLLGTLLFWSGGAQGRLRDWQAVNMVLWIGGVAVSAVKVAGLTTQKGGRREGSRYPLEDQVVDVAVIMGVYVGIAVLEVVLGFWRGRREMGEGKAESENLEVGGSV